MNTVLQGIDQVGGLNRRAKVLEDLRGEAAPASLGGDAGPRFELAANGVPLGGAAGLVGSGGRLLSFQLGDAIPQRRLAGLQVVGRCLESRNWQGFLVNWV